MSEPLRRHAGARDPWALVVEGLIAFCAGAGELLAQRERPWSSATFAGTRHAVTLRFGAGEIACGSHLGTRLATEELTAPGYVVADATVVDRYYYYAAGEPRLDLTVNVLLVDLDPPSSW